MKNYKSKIGMIGKISLLLLFLYGCTFKKQEEFAMTEQDPPGTVEIQEAYAPIVESGLLESEENPYNGVGNTAMTAPKTKEEVGTLSGNMLASTENIGKDTVDTYKGVTDIILHKETFGDTKMYRMGDSNYLILEPKTENGNSKKAVTATAEKMNALQKKYPDIPIYTYYINRATDYNWYSQNKTSVFSYADYFEAQLGKDSRIQTGQYTLKDVGSYMETGYKTDFHINNRGSYEVYKEIYEMFSNNLELSDMLVPLSEDDYDNLLFVGLKDGASLNLQPEQMDVFRTYHFELGDYDSYVDNKKATIGLEKEYQSGKIVRDVDFNHQFSYYGGQSATVKFDFHQPEKPNLLILSDSQGRPSRKLLASHFNQTIFLDDIQYRSMDLEQVIQENNINVILLIGQSSMFEWYENE